MPNDQSPQSKVIDGYVFTVPLMPGMIATKVFTRLVKTLGRGAASLQGALGGDASPATLGILAALDEDDVEHLAKKLLANALVQQPDSPQTGPLMPVYDAVFSGRVDMAFKVLFFALQVNFGSFSKGLGSLQSAVAQAAPQASK